MPSAFILFLLYFLPHWTLAAQSPRVLLLNSYHPQYQWTTELTRGVQDSLAETIHAE